MVFNDKDGGLLFRMRSRDEQIHQDGAKMGLDNENSYASPTALTLHSQHQSVGSGNIHDWRESDITGIVNTPSPSRSVRSRGHATWVVQEKYLCPRYQWCQKMERICPQIRK